MTILVRAGLVALVLAAGAWARDADACACCADSGQRVESTKKLDTYEKDELRRIRFGAKARLHLTPAGTTGITNPADAYDLAFVRAGDQWTFKLTSPKGAAGQLAFSLPANVTSFFVDPQDGQPGTDPVLYKEWRLEAPVTATGPFAPSTAGAPATARLVLQGRGNMCTSADDFTHWMLTVKGPRADFRLFGTLDAAASPPSP